MTTAEILVVGSGAGGSVVAYEMAKAGKKVVVVERLAKVGGMTSSGYMIPEAPGYLVTPCAVELLFARGSGIIDLPSLSVHHNSCSSM